MVKNNSIQIKDEQEAIKSFDKEMHIESVTQKNNYSNKIRMIIRSGSEQQIYS